MSFAAPDDRAYYNYSRAPGSAHGAGHESTSPDQRLPSSHSYNKGASAPSESPSQVYHPEMAGPPGSSHSYPPQPITPLTSSTAYPPQHPPSSGYYLPPQQQQQQQQQQQSEQPIPSPPSSSNRPPSATGYTPDGQPIIPVGVSGGKMFRCRGYGDCDKVFTRSEHLARHVR